MAEDFFDGYGAFKGYATPLLLDKHVRRFDRTFWTPTACTAEMAVLDLGCGTGHFLDYLRAKGVADFLGIDRDPALAEYMPPAVGGHFRAADIFRFLESGAEGRAFDRIVLFDVIEHFTPQDGVRLLRLAARVLRPGGRVLVKVPNMASPWGAHYQYGDLTHKAAYTPSSMRQLALASGYACTACYADAEGSPVRRVLDRLFHAALGRILMTPPEIWSANFFAVLEPRES